MIGYLRDMSEKPFAKVLIALLLFSFVGWGVAEWILGASNRSDLIKVGSLGISMDKFQTDRNRQISLLSSANQKLLYTDKKYSSVFHSELIKNTINDLLLENRVRDLKLVVSDKKVADQIKLFPEFQEKGKYSSFKFYNILANNNYTEEKFADFVRSQILKSYLLTPFSLKPNIPDFIVKTAYKSRFGKKNIDYLVVNFDEFKVPSADDEKLKEFYLKNPIMTQESRDISYILIKTDMNKPDSFENGYKKAQALEDYIFSGDSFDTASKKLGSFAKLISVKSVVPNKSYDNILTSDLISKLFNTDENVETEILETKFGFVIAKVDKINERKKVDFKNVKSDVIKAWKLEEQKKQAYLKVNSFLTQLNDKKSLPNLKNITVSRTEGLPLEVLYNIYNNKVGSSFIVPNKNSFYLVSIKKDIFEDIDKKKIENLKHELISSYSSMLLADYNSFLLRTYKIKMNDKMINRLVNNGENE